MRKLFLMPLLIGVVFLFTCTKKATETYVTSYKYPEQISPDEKARFAGHVVPGFI